MKLGDILKNRQKRTVRENRIEAIERLGFKLLDERGWHNGKFYPRRYFLEMPDGTRLGKDGEGFGSSSEALQAALAESEKAKGTVDSRSNVAQGQP